jgi:hypothetical protein
MGWGNWNSIIWFADPSLAFLAGVRNNPFVKVMRFTCGLAIAFGLSFPAGGQTPDTSAPAATTPVAGKKAPESAAKEKTDAGSASTGSPSNGSASAATKRRKRTTPAPAPAPDSGPRRIVVRNGGASEPSAQIVPGIAPAEATRQRQNAGRFLGSADDQLKQLAGRTLNTQQQETVGQIHNYMDGARSALKEGDVQRASTLAEKAHLLAEDLAKH